MFDIRTPSLLPVDEMNDLAAKVGNTKRNCSSFRPLGPSDYFLISLDKTDTF